MMTPQEQRRIRLKNDYLQMCNIRGGLITWRATNGAPPYVDVYDLEINVRTIVSSAPAYRDRHKLELVLPANYPNTPPVVTMLSKPQPFHPNWFTSGRWCHGSHSYSEGLGEYVVRMIRTLQFDSEITNPDSPANSDAKVWYLNRQGSGIFPCDRQVLPDPTSGRNSQKDLQASKTFRIE